MRFFVVTACLAAFVVFVISERCHPDDNLEDVCVLTSCNGNDTMVICEHDECTCAIDTRIHCMMKSDCEHLPDNCGDEGHHPPHHHGPADGNKEWHCLDSVCKCF